MALIRGRRLTFIPFLLAVSNLVAQDSGPVRRLGTLQSNQGIERELGTGQIDEYTIQVPAGRFVRFVAQQMGADVLVTVLDPEGKTVLQADRPNGMFGPEAASFVAVAAGEYHVHVSNGSGPAGRYRMESLESREPADADRNRIEAERAGFQAAQDGQPNNRETRLHRIELYQRAVSTWHDLGDTYEEGLSEYGMAGIYDDIGEGQKAVDVYGRALSLRRAAGDQRGEADTLSSLGSEYEDKGEKQKALDYYGQAISLRRTLGDRAGEAVALNAMGRVYYALGEHQKALDYFGQALSLRRALGNRAGEASILNNIGNVYYTLNQKAKALEYYAEALPLCRAAGDRATESTTLANLGTVYETLGESQKALKIYAQALPVLRALNDRAAEANTLSKTGRIYSVLGERQKALEFFNQAVPLFHTLGDRKAEAVTLQRIGALHDDLRQKQSSLESYLQALPLLQALNDREAEALTLSNIGVLYTAVGKPQQALEFLNQALPLRHALGDRAGEAYALFNIGNVYNSLGDQPKALEHFNQALPMVRATGNRAREADILYMIGTAQSRLGEKQAALDYYTQALSLYRALKSRADEADTLNNIGVVYNDLGEKRKALEYYNQALPSMRAAGDRNGEAATLSNIASVYDDLGEHQKALEYDALSLPLRRVAGDRSGEAATLNNIGLVYSRLGDKQKALEQYTQALSVYHDIGDRFGEAAALSNIGRAYDGLGERQKALEYFTQALPLRRALGDRAGEASTLDNLGGVYADLGEKQKALEYYTQALPLNRVVDDRSGESLTLLNIGSAYEALGEKQKALEYYGQSLPISRAVGDRAVEAAALSNISFIFEKTQPELAVFFEKQAVNILQTLRRDNRVLDGSLRKTFEKSIEGNYRHLAGLLVGRQRFGEAEEVLDLLKDKEAADFIRRDSVTDQLKAATLLDSERKALERYEQILTQIVSDGQAKSALVAKASKEALSTAETDRSRQLDRDLAAANTVLLRFFDEQEKAFAANSAAAKRVGELRESEGLQDTLQALGPDVVAIYTLVLPDKYTAMLISSGARKAYSTAIPEADLNRKIFNFRQQLQNPGSNPLPLAQELYKILFPEGLRQDLETVGAKTIMWSIDSTIRYVPIAALHDGEHYLVSRFRNSLITPASLTRLTDASQPLWKGVGFGVSKANGDFSALPAVPGELGRIFRQGDMGDAPVPGRVRLDPDFTRESFEAAMRQPDKSVVHIATHFASRPGVAANSHLLLGDGTELSLAEIEAIPRLFSGVDLLTLSACSTAFTNGAEDGREVDSFGTIAQRLGAKGVIASLWSVNDEATARLMETMYRIRQGKPELGKSEALRQAQEQMASGVLKPVAGDAGDRGIRVPGAQTASTGWTHPYYWAPFILIGNWK